jgi:CHASE3 domain sensor protein
MRVTARSTGVIVGLTIAVLIGTGAMLAITHSNSAARQQRLVVGSYETLALMRQAVIALQDTEIGQRAYLLSGEVADLQPYERSRLRIETELRQLEAAAASDPDTMQQVREFRAAANEKLEQLNSTVTTYQLYGRDAALSFERTGAGRKTSDQLRQIANSFIEGQRLLLARRLTMLRSEQDQSDIAGLLVMAGAFLCLIVGMYIVVRSASRLEDTQRELGERSRLLQTTRSLALRSFASGARAARAAEARRRGARPVADGSRLLRRPRLRSLARRDDGRRCGRPLRRYHREAAR